MRGVEFERRPRAGRGVACPEVEGVLAASVEGAAIDIMKFAREPRFLSEEEDRSRRGRLEEEERSEMLEW
jgi:hypothetical protein